MTRESFEILFSVFISKAFKRKGYKEVCIPLYPYYIQANYLLSSLPAGTVSPRLNFSGTLLLAGETLIYPCISWWSALQKSVQYIGNIPTLSGTHLRVVVSPGIISN